MCESCCVIITVDKQKIFGKDLMYQAQLKPGYKEGNDDEKETVDCIHHCPYHDLPHGADGGIWKYQLRIRAFKKVGKKTYYGAWSTISTGKPK